MEGCLELSIAPVWSRVREVREHVARLVEQAPPALRAASIMTASELVENAIKYGETVAGAEAVSFVFHAAPDRIRIEVKNGSTNRAGVAELRRRIEEISSAEDRQAMYLFRLEELLRCPDQSGKLGIYRIGFEGGFELGFDYVDDVVTVTATRQR
jgi:anti-sigma regulatory factor (Ser/Thr protein kinase)